MRISSISKFLVVALLSSGSVALAKDPPKTAPKTPAKTQPKAAPKVAPKKVTVVTADHAKALATLMGGYKFGMTKDEVIAGLAKALDDKYDAQIKATTDVTQQDKLRANRKREIAEIKNGYTEFTGKKGGWDVSIIEDEFTHNTNESMLERWEKSGNMDQRRFFFFYEGKLWKMFISLNVSILPEDKKNFESFKQTMFNAYGPGDLDVGLISWHTNDFDVRAVDKLKSYDALGLAIESNAVKKDLFALREAKAPKKQETPSVIKSMIDPDGKDHPDVKQNNTAVDAVIKAQKK